jgi:hypothetical protein
MFPSAGSATEVILPAPTVMVSMKVWLPVGSQLGEPISIHTYLFILICPSQKGCFGGSMADHVTPASPWSPRRRHDRAPNDQEEARDQRIKERRPALFAFC